MERLHQLRAGILPQADGERAERRLQSRAECLEKALLACPETEKIDLRLAAAPEPGKLLRREAALSDSGIDGTDALDITADLAPGKHGQRTLAGVGETEMDLRMVREIGLSVYAAGDAHAPLAKAVLPQSAVEQDARSKAEQAAFFKTVLRGVCEPSLGENGNILRRQRIDRHFIELHGQTPFS